MTPRKLVSLLLLGAALTIGCKKEAPSGDASDSAVGWDTVSTWRQRWSRPKLTAAASFSPASLAQHRAAQRYIAVRHTLEIVTPGGELQKDWASTIAFCATIRCEVTGSSLKGGADGAAPSATVSLRVVPEDLPRLLGHVEKTGRVAEHTTATEDKTDSVIDADAKIQNLTSYRDSLRGLLNRSSASLKDLVEIEEKLTEVQSKLDGEAMIRQLLANETEKVAVHITFVTTEPVIERGFLGRIFGALRESGDTFTDSIESLIQVVVAVIPWLVVLVPVVWGIVRLFRGLRRKRAPAPPPVTGQP